MASTELTAEALRMALQYDPETGAFTWLQDRSTRVHAGDIAGCTTKLGYCQIRLNGRAYWAHRLAWLYMTGRWPTFEIDHRDTDPSNNRWLNLRDVTPKVNKQNRRKPLRNNKSSGLLGVSVNPTSGKFQARLWTDGRNVFLGEFAVAADAHAAYLNAKRALHQGCTL